MVIWKTKTHRNKLRVKSNRLSTLCIPFLLILFTTISSASAAEKIEFSAETMTGSTKTKTSNTVLSGNAYIKTPSVEIKADSITMKGDNFRFITATGNVKGVNTNSKMEFTCTTLEYDRETKIIILKNTVNLKDVENSVEANAQIIEYNQDTETAVMQIEVTLLQKNNTCTSAYAIYRKKQQKLDMSGNAKVIQGDDTFRAQEITLDLTTQEITLNGRVQGSVTSTNKSAGKGTQDTPTPPAADSAASSQEQNTTGQQSDQEQAADSEDSE